MPLYEYRCEQCGEQFEVMQKFSDEPLTTHPNCGGPVHRLLSAPALQFKGSGWYVTDYAKGSAKPASDNGAPAKSDTTTKAGSESSASTPASSSTSETKPNSDTKSKS
jgi:putative FmdB family regulatory protein